MKGTDEETLEDADDMIRDCRLVFKTSNGDVISAAVVPLIAPLKKAKSAPRCPCLSNSDFQFS